MVGKTSATTSNNNETQQHNLTVHSANGIVTRAPRGEGVISAAYSPSDEWTRDLESGCLQGGGEHPNSQENGTTNTDSQGRVIPVSERNAAIIRHGSSTTGVENVTIGVEKVTTNKNKKNTKATLRIATLNMKGFQSGHRNDDPMSNKWRRIDEMMKSDRIAIMMLQETHLDLARRTKTEKGFERTLKILSSADPDSPSGRAGVAIVLNKRLIPVDGVRVNVIVPGRAMMVTLKPHGDKPITILNVYAPNDPKKNGEFWIDIQRKIMRISNGRKPIIMGGDFNMVEDPIDRWPTREEDRQETKEALDGLKKQLQLIDGWRETYPDTRDFTFIQPAAFSQGTKSRLDRIYVHHNLLATTNNWEISESNVPGADHAMLKVEMQLGDTPEVGTGRWSIPAYIVKDKLLAKIINEKGRAALTKLEEIKNHGRTEERSPQTVYTAFKQEILREARTRQKQMTPPIIKEIAKLRDGIKPKTKANGSADAEDPQQQEEEEINRVIQTRAKIAELEQKILGKRKKHTRVKYRIECETVTKSWFRVNKDIKPRDMMHSLKKKNRRSQNDPTHEKNSKRMAELARDYHESIQKLDLANEEEATLETQRATSQIKTTLTNEQKERMRKPIAEDEVRSAIRKAETSRAAGIDGATYELWKTLLSRNENDERRNAPAFDIVKLMTANFQDIQEFGITKGSNFNEGWMCPIYKKKNRDEIENYRPITLLNTDYKIMTKVLAMRLAKVITTVVHTNQAGFIPGRKIADQTKLIRMVINYGEVAEVNGAILALDQEKAYDKIKHEYLWTTLERFNFPKEFVGTLKSLYQDANTKVMINGYLSSPFRVTRGVRQGDPMSCLLFDLAIEPLASLLRESEIARIRPPRSKDKLIANLFADDTTIFLNEDDNLDDLYPILEGWCKASGAKFNHQKTQIIPYGKIEYREKLVAERKLNNRCSPIDASIKIAGNGEPIRILGAWFGNGVNPNQIWSPICDKINHELDRWERSNPTMEGRKIIVQTVVGGMTQYLTQVQGMPKDIENKLARTIRDFIWAGNTTHTIKEDVLFEPIEKGGRGLMDIKARNEAINIIWLKDFLNLGPTKPMWTEFAEQILAIRVPKEEERWPIEVRINPFLQTWRPRRKPNEGTPKELIDLLELATKYKLRIEGPPPNLKMAEARPIWLHRQAAPQMRPMVNLEASRCLRINHRVMTAGEMARATHQDRHERHIEKPSCECETCCKIRNEEAPGCRNPHICTERARKIIATLQPEWNPLNPLERTEHSQEPQSQETRGEWLSFEASDNLNSAEEEHLGQLFRIFTAGWGNKEETDPERHTDKHLVAPRGPAEIKITSERVNGAWKIKTYVRTSESTTTSLCGLPHKNEPGEGDILEAITDIVGAIQPEEEIWVEIGNLRTVQNLTKYLERHEDEGFLKLEDPRLFCRAVAILRARKGATYLKHCKGKAGEATNPHTTGILDNTRWVQTGWQEETQTTPYLKTGAKLASMTQALAYRHIRQAKSETKDLTRRETTRNLEAIMEAAEGTFKRPNLKERDVWMAIREKTTPKNIRNFFWLAIHGGYKIGNYWAKPGWPQDLQERAICKTCDMTETLRHILIECKIECRRNIWMAAEAAGRKKGIAPWPQINYGVALASQTAELKSEDTKTDPGMTRFYKIVMSEAVYLIWKLRCERVIQNQNKPTNLEMAIKRLEMALNGRLETDIKRLSPAYLSKRLPKKLVLDTWRGVIKDENALPNDWTSIDEVLVGIG